MLAAAHSSPAMRHAPVDVVQTTSEQHVCKALLWRNSCIEFLAQARKFFGAASELRILIISENETRCGVTKKPGCRGREGREGCRSELKYYTMQLIP